MGQKLTSKKYFAALNLFSNLNKEYLISFYGFNNQPIYFMITTFDDKVIPVKEFKIKKEQIKDYILNNNFFKECKTSKEILLKLKPFLSNNNLKLLEKDNNLYLNIINLNLTFTLNLINQNINYTPNNIRFNNEFKLLSKINLQTNLKIFDKKKDNTINFKLINRNILSIYCFSHKNIIIKFFNLITYLEKKVIEFKTNNSDEKFIYCRIYSIKNGDFVISYYLENVKENRIYTFLNFYRQNNYDLFQNIKLDDYFLRLTEFKENILLFSDALKLQQNNLIINIYKKNQNNIYELINTKQVEHCFLAFENLNYENKFFIIEISNNNHFYFIYDLKEYKEKNFGNLNIFKINVNGIQYFTYYQKYLLLNNRKNIFIFNFIENIIISQIIIKEINFIYHYISDIFLFFSDNGTLLQYKAINDFKDFIQISQKELPNKINIFEILKNPIEINSKGKIIEMGNDYVIRILG